MACDEIQPQFGRSIWDFGKDGWDGMKMVNGVWMVST